MLATWNGEQFLQQQLQSFKSQTVSNIDLWVSDDGSKDKTVSLLEHFGESWAKGSFNLLRRRRKAKSASRTPTYGSNDNFRSLILNEDIDGDFFAFSDQDDIWDDDKLERAGAWLSEQPKDVPCLYCSRTRIVNADGKVTGTAPLFKKPPSLENALVQNIAAGNTIVMNRKAIELIRMSCVHSNFVSHDWWCYLVVVAFGGIVKYDGVPSLSYRQHANNLIGENSSWKARMTRLRQVLDGRFKRWNDQNRIALSSIEQHLPKETREFLITYDDARSKTGLSAALKLRKTGVFRQTQFGQFSLYLASIVGKI